MKALYLRIYLTVVAVLLVFALVAGWLFQKNVEREREVAQAQWRDRGNAFGELIQNSLPHPSAPSEQQRDALLDWAQRLRLPLALDDPAGERIATSESFLRREAEFAGSGRAATRISLSDGRALWIWRPPGGPQRPGDGPPREGERGPEGFRPGPFGFPIPGGLGLVVALVVLFLAIALGAYPVVRRLTRRLESLKLGVERFGAGQLNLRVDEGGRDEVAAVATSFNRAAERIESLVGSHRTLLANASHELRSPLARLKMAVAMLPTATGENRESLKAEIERDIRELDSLVEEVLMASRLDAQRELDTVERVDLLALAAEEAARVDATVEGDDVQLRGSDRLLRRALRNLLENARRYGGEQRPELSVRRGAQEVQVVVADRGPGVPSAEAERIFEPFYRLPGHAEQTGGVGLGLSLVRQIAQRHGGRVHVEARAGGGSRFVLSLPLQGPPGPGAGRPIA